jgi:PadR family transcriptional regulator PadR
MKWRINMAFQVGTALLDACVLATLSKEDAYGYVLTQNVKEIISVSESTLYPVLRRLQKEDCLTAYDQPFSGRNRRYYKITDAGKEKLTIYTREWEDYKGKVDKILYGGVEDEQA